jgi:colanic acid/amylovoran biosynthesis glycosyltransferase
MKEYLKSGLAGERSPLLLIPSISIAQDASRYILDEKVVSGLRLYSKFWPGLVRCVFRKGDQSALLFSRTYDPAELPFEIDILPANAEIPDELIVGSSVVLASGDNWLDFPVADQGLRLGVPVCFVIEQILETRLQIIRLSDASFVNKAKSLVWTIMAERKRRRAFDRSAGLQSNGTPAAKAYSGLVGNVLTFFDTRLSEKQMATDHEILAKQARLMKGAPLRLVFTGRLEKIKGADDLIKIAAALDRAGKNFRLDIYGSGRLESEMNAALNDLATTCSLREKVTIHRPIDFERELVPWMRAEADLFLCCHRQSDPSCTYLETLGCGVPIVGYNNSAWRGILNLADVGWMAPLNARGKIVQKIVDLDINRVELCHKLRTVRDFAKVHSFECEFEKRINHLRQIANV